MSFSAVGSWSIHGCQRPVFIWHINLAMTKWIAERLHKDFCLQAQGGKMFKPNCYSDIIGASRVSVSLCLAKSHFFGFLLLWTRRFKGTVADIKQSSDSAPRQKRCLEYLPFNGIVVLLRYLIWPGSNKVCGSMGAEIFSIFLLCIRYTEPNRCETTPTKAFFPVSFDIL